jgi:hypothetical protein
LKIKGIMIEREEGQRASIYLFSLQTLTGLERGGPLSP